MAGRVEGKVAFITGPVRGGNDLDGTPATIRVLPAIAEAVGDRVEILLDGGIRRGGDLVKALVLGARGDDWPRLPLGPGRQRPGRRESVLDILRGGIDSAALGLGHSSIHELTPDDIVIPGVSPRTLGAAGPETRPARNHRVVAVQRG
jgi:L-lactate dehydrogenase (cytochrome)/glycolate oxidase